MDRVHVPLDGPTLAQVDREREKTDTSRAQWLSSAVVQFLDLYASLNGANPATLAQELTQQKIDYEKLWKENQRLDHAEKAAREAVDQTRREVGTLKDQYAAALSELETTREEVVLLKRDLAHAMDTIRSRDQSISFLEATVHQALEKLPRALPPTEEEIIEKKSWWRFWR
jgi:chromosome segregation ATPase